MDAETIDEIAALHKLKEALAVYADETNWSLMPMYGAGQQAMLRMWVGPGDGPTVARQALISEKSEVSSGQKK